MKCSICGELVDAHQEECGRRQGPNYGGDTRGPAVRVGNVLYEWRCLNCGMRKWEHSGEKCLVEHTMRRMPESEAELVAHRSGR
jgi:hypothetical protein